MSNSDLWPVDPRTGQPLPPRAQPGYYPGFNTLGQSSFWDEATRKVVLQRVNDPPAIRFFEADEVGLLKAVCDRIMPQDDRDPYHQIPIVNGIDQRLFENRTAGYRYESMPTDQDAYRLGLRGIQAVTNHLFGQKFDAVGPREQDHVLKLLHDGKPEGGAEIWDRLPVLRFWPLLVQDIVEQYYAHPYAWDEIGFGGPAYPRAYMRLERGEPEPWEVREKRYEWLAPPSSLSGEPEAIEEMLRRGPTPGQGGTH